MKAITGNHKIDTIAFKNAALTLRAVNNRVRQQILKLLEENKRMMVTDIYVKLRLEQAVASQQLTILRRTNIVTREREGKHIYYSLNYAHITKVAEWVNELALTTSNN